MLKLFKKLFKDEEGQTAVEYALVLILVVTAVIAAYTLFEGELTDIIEGIFNELRNLLMGI